MSGAQPEHFEERARDHVAVDVVGLPVHRQVDRCRVVRKGPLEDGRPVAQALEHRLRERHDSVALVARPARVGAGSVSHDQPLGPLDGQGAQHHLVEQREDRRVGSAAEREREDHDRREGGVLPEDAQRQLQVLAESAHSRVSFAPLARHAVVPDFARDVPGGDAAAATPAQRLAAPARVGRVRMRTPSSRDRDAPSTGC